MSTPLLSVVLPCYNESRGIVKIVERFSTFADEYDFELILVDNGSRDDTQEVMSEVLPSHSFARCVKIENNQGYGHGVYTGLLEAQGELLAWTHADMQTDPGDVFRAVDIWRSAADAQRLIVKGKRHGRSVSERIISRGMELVALLLLRRWIPEINAQPKLFHLSLLDSIKNPPVDFNFDVYVLYRALSNGFRIRTIDVKFPPREYGESNWSATWKSKTRTIYGCIRYMFQLGIGADSCRS